VAGCTADFVGDIWEVINVADLFHKGLPPDPGGVLDQCQWFIETAGYYRQEQSRAKAEEQGKNKNYG